MASSLYKIPLKMLGDLMSSRALERAIKDAAVARGLQLTTLDADTLEDILKREVYRRLQYSVPAPLAKRRVLEVLKEIHAAPPEDETLLVVSGVSAEEQLAAIEESSRRFSLYFDWPEAQRLRGILATARTEISAGHSIDALVQEGQELLGQLERRLEEGLVNQAQDLAELKAAFGRVQSMGGRDVRRLENLMTQIEEAQAQSTLLPGEVERARNITFKLRKSLESSVVQSVTSAPGMLDSEAQARVQALEQEHVARLLADLSRDYAALLRAQPELHTQNDALRARLEGGTITVDEAENWRATLETARAETLAQQRQELARLETQLKLLPDMGAAHDVRVTLQVVQQTLEAGSLATDELRELNNNVRALQHSPELAAKIMEHQRELAELERAARDVPGAEEALREQIGQARQLLVRGQDVDLGELWIVLEQHMGEAAQQREGFDARADHVIEEYDQVRSLAGETIQRLGRLADSLRAQRRLGPMSAQARERYTQTLTDAEALLSEARAEYQAAQEVTSAFGKDALSGLLDVFDLGDEGDGGLFAPQADAAALAGPASDTASDTGEAAPTSANSGADALFGSLLGGATSPAAPAEAPASAPAAAPASLGQPGRWQISDGLITAGDTDEHLADMAALLGRADRLGLSRLDMADSGYVWSARQTGPGEWRLARSRSWDDLDSEAGSWLDSGQN